MKLRCPLPECRQTFQWNSGEPWPDDCQVCGCFIGSHGGNGVSAPYIALKGGAYAKSVDKVYRDAEAASEVRMEQAAAMTPGASKSDFSALKITDYKPMVEGESAVRMPQPSEEFNRNVAALQSAGVAVQQNGGIELSGQVQAFSNQTRVGPEPNAGVRAMDRLRTVHRSNVDPRMSTPISSIPALETQRPGYVPRGAPIIPGVNR